MCAKLTVRDMPPRNVLKNSCLEIESGGFWQLADYPTLVSKTTCMFNEILDIFKEKNH